MKTKNSTLCFSVYYYLWDLALPLHINIEYLSKDYTEIQLHILCFTLDFTRILHKYNEELDKMFKESGNG